ncbi:Outer membrane protein [Methylacidimicrobium sp. AP8]|uniref:TolC family protein n=1 Tax=Methylacidimicrobium sp. AP8 TaxID=2730359 RepID=UPI0018C026D8|nr:TolC family protein [Methylacidimicrobium sp. AP8]CAB4242527.1 Outer membrane protein [Methylacidimicrobium sp. AP8]
MSPLRPAGSALALLFLAGLAGAGITESTGQTPPPPEPAVGTQTMEFRSRASRPEEADPPKRPMARDKEAIGSEHPLIRFWKKVQAHYPELKKKHAKLQEMLAQKALATSGFLPRVYGWADSITTDNPVLGFMFHLTERNFSAGDFNINTLNHPGTVSNQNMGIMALVPIFDAMQTIDSIRTAKHLIRQSEQEERFTRMEASLLAIDAYLQLLLAEREAALARLDVQASARDLEQAVRLMEQGLVLGADFYAGRSMSASLEQSQNGYLSKRKVALVTVNTLQGESADAEVSVAGSIPAPHKGPTKPLEQWVQEALLYRSDLLALQSSIAAQHSEVGRIKATALPSVSGFASGMLDSDNFNTGGRSYTVGVLGTVPLFDPSRDPKVKQAQAAEEQLRHEAASLRDLIQNKLGQAYAEYQGALQDAEILGRASADARKSTEMMAELYREGRKTIVDLLSVRQMQLQTEIGYWDSLARAELSRAKLYFLSGQLDDYQVQQIAQEIGGAVP